MNAAVARSRRTLVAALGLAPLFALGCSGAAQSGDDAAQIQSALEQDNGGMSTSPEAPAFDDPKVQAVSDFSASFADPSDMTAQAASVTGARSYHVAIVWGHLPAPHDGDDTSVEPPSAPIDWTGSISVDAGAIGVLRTLQFDSGDHVDPRSDPKAVSFVSHTLPAIDGLYLRVIVPANGSSTLHFGTASLQTDVDLSQLATSPGGVVRLGDERDGMAYLGFADVPGCARGLVLGRWNKVRPHLGVLRGRVIGAGAESLGHVRGVWGHSQHKDRDVFFGKYIDQDGEFRGLFGGTYGAGQFEGIWGTVDPKDAGTVEGVYSDGLDRNDGRGVFLGRWSERCGQ